MIQILSYFEVNHRLFRHKEVRQVYILPNKYIIQRWKCFLMKKEETPYKVAKYPKFMAWYILFQNILFLKRKSVDQRKTFFHLWLLSYIMLNYQIRLTSSSKISSSNSSNCDWLYLNCNLCRIWETSVNKASWYLKYKI
jgi:hypothetical protein